MQITTLKQDLHDCKVLNDELSNKLSNKRWELQECQNNNHSLETKIMNLKDSIKDKVNHIESMCNKLNKKENLLKELSNEMDTVKKAKTMIELILNKTNTEIESLHEENTKYVSSLLTTIENYKKSEGLSHTSISQLENSIIKMQDNLADKEKMIISYEKQIAEYSQSSSNQERQLQSVYQEKLALELQLKDMKTEIETQQKAFSNKNCEMENYLAYYLDELKDIKMNKTKVEEILLCKQSEIDKQLELFNYQKNIIKTLQSEKYNNEISINDLNEVLQQKSSENTELKNTILEHTLNFNKLNEQLNATLNINKILENNLKTNELQMKTLSEEYDNKMYDIKNTLESQINEINCNKIDLEKLKDILDQKQNDLNEQVLKCNKQIETISHLQLEKTELEEKLKLNSNILLDKENSNKSLVEKLVQNELQIEDLTKKIDLKVSENHLLTKTLDMITINMQDDFDKLLSKIKMNTLFYNNKIDNLTETLLKLKNYLCCKTNELNNLISLSNKQEECICLFKTEKLDLLEKTKVLDQCLLQKDTEIACLKKTHEGHSLNVNKLEEQLGVMSIEKVIIETNLNENIVQLKNLHEQINDISIQLRNCEDENIQLKNQSSKIEKILEKNQNDLDEQFELAHKQYEIINIMKLEKIVLEKQVLNANEQSIANQKEIKSLQDILDSYKSSVLNLKNNLNSKSIEIDLLSTKLKNSEDEKQSVIHEFEKQTKQLEHAANDNSSVENMCTGLQVELKELNECLFKKQEFIKALEFQNSNFSTTNDNLEKRIIELKEILNSKHDKLENQILWCDEQKEIIIQINREKESLNNEINHLEDDLSQEKYKFNLCEGKLYDCSNTIDNLEKKIDEMKNEKSSLELQLNKTITQLTNTNNDLSLQLEVKEKIVWEIKEKLIHQENELEKQLELLNEHFKTISLLNEEKNTLLEKNNTIHECLDKKEITLKSLQETIFDYEKHCVELETLKINLESELNENKIQFKEKNQELVVQLEDVENKFTEVQEQLNKKQVKIDEYIFKYNCQRETVALLTSERDNLANEINVLKNTLLNNDDIITSVREKLLEYEEQNIELKTKNVTLEIELTQAYKQSEIKNQDLTRHIKEIEDKLSILEEELNFKKVELETQKNVNMEKMEIITILTSDKDNLISESNSLKGHLLETKNALASNQTKLINFESLLKDIESRNICLQSELKESKEQVDNNQYDMTQKLETTKSELCIIEEQFFKLQVDLEKQNKYLNQEKEVVNNLICERNSLVDEAKVIKECLTQKEYNLESKQNKFADYNDHSKKIETPNASLLLKLNELKSELNSLRQQSTEQIVEMNKKLCEAQDQLSQHQSEMKLKNNSLIDIYHKINDLKNIKNELALILSKERTEFDLCVETCSNYTLNCINNKSIDDYHQDSLLEVITSADTFIEQNGIHLAQVDNCNEYPIIEKLKKLFEALKMFIININTQGNDQLAVIHTDSTCTSNEAYTELLTKSNAYVFNCIKYNVFGY